MVELDGRCRSGEIIGSVVDQYPLTGSAVRDLRDRLEQLSPRHRAALARRLQDLFSEGVVKPDNGRNRLVAYLVSRTGSTIDVEELRRQMGRRLPEYMVPSSFVFLDAVPRTPNGKVDRSALPDPEVQSDSEDDAYIAPCSEIEHTLAGVWAEVLGFDSVGIRDNFFEMGGDSLLSIRIIARAAEAGIYVTPEQFVDKPTIEEQAAIAETSSTGATLATAVGEVLPLTSVQQGADSFTPSDFPVADLEQNELDRIFDLIQGLDEE